MVSTRSGCWECSGPVRPTKIGAVIVVESPLVVGAHQRVAEYGAHFVRVGNPECRQ